MALGEDLFLTDEFPLDSEFRSNLDRLQDIFLAWQRSLGVSLSRIAIHAADRAEPATSNDEVVSFFSGGVDGSYTALRNRERISRAILLRGIDMQLENTELWDAAKASAEQLADHFNLQLETISTNLRFLGHHFGIGWATTYQGAGLATIGHLLRPKQVLIAATNSLADLEPYGSHPLSDPLFSSNTTEFIHEGAVPRTEKLKAIGSDPEIMKVLRVCWQDSGYNCGKCGKCLRTMTALHLLGVESPTFPSTVDWRAVGKMRLGDPSQWAFFEALRQLEQEKPDPAAGRALNRIRRRNLLHSGFRDLDAVFGAPVKRIKKILRPLID